MTDPSPFDTLQLLAGGYCVPRCLHAIADLGVADALDETPRTAAELAASVERAASVGVDADALDRVLRLLSAHGVFERQGDGFRHSSASRLLRADHPQSMRAFVRMFGLAINWTAYEALEHSIRTGLPATEKILPGGFWAYFAERPEESRIFNAAMAAKAHGQIAGVLAVYDFSGFDLIADIGGGRGHLLQAVLDSAPNTKGVLFDLPHVVAEVASLASERLTLQAGDFFKDALPRCDAYLLMEVIHDWGDEESGAILQAIRRAAPDHAKLLLIEAIVPDDPGPHWSKLLDIHMLTLVGGRQRARGEYEALLNKAGLSVEREIDTGAGVSILEARIA